MCGELHQLILLVQAQIKETAVKCWIEFLPSKVVETPDTSSAQP
jgi:hypothetical protein